MSMFGQIGSEITAKDILSFIEKKKLEHADKPDILTVLEEIAQKAREIITSAQAGWC